MNESHSINKNIHVAPEICPTVLLILCTEKVFLYCHGPAKHTVILLGSILQAFMVILECEFLASQIKLEASNIRHY